MTSSITDDNVNAPVIARYERIKATLIMHGK